VGAHTFRVVAIASNDYVLHPASGVTFRLGQAANRIASVDTTVLSLAGLEFYIGGAIISPAQITATQNNYNPTGLGTARILRLTSDASRDITGIAAAGNGGQVITIINVAAQDIVLKYLNGGSSSANQIVTPGAGDLTLGAGDAATLFYDITSSLWRTLGY
jgi:hypothetical protein